VSSDVGKYVWCDRRQQPAPTDRRPIWCAPGKGHPLGAASGVQVRAFPSAASPAAAPT